MARSEMAVLRAEVPFLKLRDNLDFTFMLVAMLSFVLHVAMAGYLRSLPPPDTPARLITQSWQVPRAEIYIPVPDDEPLTPRPVAQGNRSGVKQGTGPGNGSATGAENNGLLQVLERQSDLVALITRDSDLGDAIQSVTALNDGPVRLHGGVRVARHEDQPGAVTDFGNGLQISDGVENLRPQGTVQIDQRSRRKIKVRMTGQPLVSTTSSSDARRLVRHALYAKRPAVRYCYEKALKLHPELTGKVRVQVSFDASGAVTAVSLLENTIADASVGACIVNALRSVKTPQQLGEPTSAAVPYVFFAVE